MSAAQSTVQGERTSQDLLVRQTLALRDIGSHVRLDQKRKDVAALDVLSLNGKGGLPGHDLLFLLFDELHAESPHDVKGVRGSLVALGRL